MEVITTEAQLYDRLVEYMRQTGETRPYPKAVIDLAECIVRLIPEFLVEEHILESLYGDERCPCCDRTDSTLLGHVFANLAGSAEQLPYSSTLVAFVARVAPLLRAGIPLDVANREAIEILGLVAGGVVTESRRGKTYWLETTRAGCTQLHVKIKIEQDCSMLERPRADTLDPVDLD
ncbi:hypothetical protein AA309_05395 [Microvirga vignae]|uniref:Uncharacterized protein n=1 Tax=Microvirga vignae TaxID=1225564 RepID=A0A0H1RFF0_9HYPH|nr:hypothetical protein [Microvirga vignae]KLK93920.1 hypothetical protein AA309_05395 [Microvirga vignae]